MNERDYEIRIRQYMPMLYRIARTILKNDQDCADAVQEAILRGWAKRGQLRDESMFRPWLARITVNECRNIQRSAYKQLRAVDASIRHIELQGKTGGGPSRTELEAALSELPEKYSLPLVLYYSEHYTTREISTALDIPEGRLRERMRTARTILKRRLNHEDAD